MFVLSSPVTGAAQTGFTAPTYTLAADFVAGNNSKQHVVTALGGTQTGAHIHSVSSPFTISVSRPPVFKQPGVVNPATGLLRSVPRNSYTVITRVGVVPLTGQPPIPAFIRTELVVPAGSDVYDAASLRAMVSLHIGALWQQPAGLGDTLIAGTLG
jgi:hypothetical protein